MPDLLSRAARLLLLMLLLTACNRDPPAASSGGGWGGPGGPRPATPVRVVTAVQEDLTLRLKALGTVTPLHTVTVRPRVEGELLRIAFDEGQQVEAGQLLAEIDPEPFRIRLAQAQGQQQQNLAELDNARRQLQRYTDLQAGSFVSAQDLSDQQARVRRRGCASSRAAATATRPPWTRPGCNCNTPASPRRWPGASACARWMWAT